MEKTLKEVAQEVEDLNKKVSLFLERLSNHEALQGQKETAIFNHIESIKNHGMDQKAVDSIKKSLNKSND